MKAALRRATPLPLGGLPERKRRDGDEEPRLSRLLALGFGAFDSQRRTTTRVPILTRS